MGQSKETRLLRNYLKDLKTNTGVVSYKIHGDPMQVAGIPDVLMCVDGSFVGLEAKQITDKGTLDINSLLSKVQHVELENIAKAGGKARVVVFIQYKKFRATGIFRYSKEMPVIDLKADVFDIIRDGVKGYKNTSDEYDLFGYIYIHNRSSHIHYFWSTL